MDINKILSTIDKCMEGLSALKEEINSNKQEHLFPDFKITDSKPKGKVIYSNEIHSVIHYYNMKFSKKILVTDKRLSLIKKMVDISSVQVAKNVILTRGMEWHKDDDMKKHLTIETLFRPSNYPKYVDAIDDILSNTTSSNSIKIGEKRNVHA